MMAGEKTIVCFGEVLWDCLPKGLFLGGAPVNVAYHVQQFDGFQGFALTAVGDDFLGKEILRRMDALGLTTDGVTIDRERATGAVIVDLTSGGNAGYRFLEDVAWDNIGIPETRMPGAGQVAALVYGTLAFRNPQNRDTFDYILSRYRDTYKICDLNLRIPYGGVGIAMEMGKRADMVKLNHEELGMLLGEGVGDVGGMEDQSRRLSGLFGDVKICVTAGANGAGYLDGLRGEWYWGSSRPIKVLDTVGAGDSFLATFIVHMERGAGIRESLQKACRMGEYVAGCDGATPRHP